MTGLEEDSTILCSTAAPEAARYASERVNQNCYSCVYVQQEAERIEHEGTRYITHDHVKQEERADQLRVVEVPKHLQQRILQKSFHPGPLACFSCLSLSASLSSPLGGLRRRNLRTALLFPHTRLSTLCGAPIAQHRSCTTECPLPTSSTSPTSGRRITPNKKEEGVVEKGGRNSGNL